MSTPLPNSPMFDWRRFIAIAETEKGHENGFSAQEVHIWEETLGAMNKTPEGRQALAQLWAIGQNYVSFNPGNSLYNDGKIVIINSGKDSLRGNSANQSLRTIYLSPDEINSSYIQTPRGLERVSPQEVLIHEIYHMADQGLVLSAQHAPANPNFLVQFWEFAAQKMVQGDLSDGAKAAILSKAVLDTDVLTAAGLRVGPLMARMQLAGILNPNRMNHSNMAQLDALLASPDVRHFFAALESPELREAVKKRFSGLNGWGVADTENVPYRDEILSQDFTIIAPKNPQEAKTLIAWVMDNHVLPHEDRATQFTDAYMATYAKDAPVRRDYGNFCTDDRAPLKPQPAMQREIHPEPQTTAHQAGMAALLRGENIPKLNLPNANTDMILVSPCAKAILPEQLAPKL